MSIKWGMLRRVVEGGIVFDGGGDSRHCLRIGGLKKCGCLAEEEEVVVLRHAENNAG